MAFTVAFTSGETTEFDDRARFSIDESGALHITTPDERTIHSSHSWLTIVEQHDPRQPSTRFV
jgi:hypothetical protein